jgi:hypothetical protein
MEPNLKKKILELKIEFFKNKFYRFLQQKINQQERSFTTTSND